MSATRRIDSAAVLLRTGLGERNVQLATDEIKRLGSDFRHERLFKN